MKRFAATRRGAERFSTEFEKTLRCASRRSKREANRSDHVPLPNSGISMNA
jgi:hypothetical protein